MFETQGKVDKKLDIQSGVGKESGKEWQKQEFVITTIEQYPKTVCFTLFGEKMGQLEKIEVGDTVKVNFSVESREWNGRYFHNINAFAVDHVLEETTPGTTPPETFQSTAQDGNDLPF